MKEEKERKEGAREGERKRGRLVLLILWVHSSFKFCTQEIEICQITFLVFRES